MRRAAHLIAELYDLGAELRLDAGQLQCRAPEGVLTPERREELARRKAEIVEFLRMHRDEPAPAGVGFPLSYGQQALWFIHLQDPASPAYNTSLPLRLDGPLDPMALERTLWALIERHPALRTAIAVVDGQPWQEVWPARCELVRHDASGWSEEHLQRRIHEIHAEPFRLTEGPGLRLHLFGLAPSRHLLLFSIHHIFSDGSSWDLLLDELMAGYAAEARGEPAAWPPPETSFAGYVRWERAMLGGAEGARLAAYWLDQLSGEIPGLELPAGHARPPVQTGRGASLAFPLPAELGAALGRLARQGKTTLYTVLLTAFQVLLHRHTGQEEIWIGTPTAAGRRQQEYAGLFGYLVNPVVLRTRIDAAAEPSFRALLADNWQTVLDAFDHQGYPFALLTQLLHARRGSTRAPLFRAMFAFEHESLLKSSREAGGLKASYAPLAQHEGQFDLTLTIVERDPLTVVIRYSLDLFEAAGIERMAGHFRTLLEGIADGDGAGADLPVSRLPLLSEAERRQILLEWNDTATDYPRGRRIDQLFDEQAGRAPDAIAVHCEAGTLSYRELRERANRLAHRLQALGVGPDTPVGLCLERGPDRVVGLLGILKAGGAYLPLDPDYPAERLAFMLADAGADLVISQARLRPGLPADCRALCLDGEREALADWPATTPESATDAGGLAYVMYTSGSTGRPKGVAIPHRAIARLVCNTDYVQIAPGDRVAQASNASFDALTFELWGALANGASLHPIDKEAALDPRVFVEKLRREGITVLFLTTAWFNQVVHAVPDAFRSLRYVLFGGEAADVQAVHLALRGGPPQHLINMYGPTENTTFTTWYRIEGVGLHAGTLPIGRPIANSRVYLLDPHLQPVPGGVAGELHAAGDGLARGYHNRPELTAGKFIEIELAGRRERVYKTGDLARWRPDGNIEFLGRIDHQVKIRGFRIEPGEIEAVLLRHPGVREAVVLAREDRAGEKRLVAYVVVADGHAAIGQEALDAFLRAQLPVYMIPTAFVVLDALPLTPNGKIDRRALPEPDDSLPASGFEPPATATEAALAAIWGEVLRRPRVGRHDNFFLLGGHSLLATQIVSRVRKAFDFDLPIRALFERPTVAALAETIEGGRLAAPPPNAGADSPDEMEWVL